jgi:hypothetical protein
MKTINNSNITTEIRKVGIALDKNRALLKRLRQKDNINLLADRSFKWLKVKGFNFNYHTHIDSLPDGRLAVMCYEEGYVIEVDGIILLPSPRTTLLA